MEAWYEIEWVLQRDEIYSPIWVSVRLIEEKWRLDQSDYIGAGGIGKCIGNNYARVGEWIREHKRVWPPVMCLDGSRHPSFTDGRHRFAWVRDHKVEAIQVVVPPEESEEFMRLYGSPIRVSRWCMQDEL